jgi:hypothetical protein
MFDPVFESLRIATESTIGMQQELFKKWISAWPGFSPYRAAGTGDVVGFQKKWAEIVDELIKKQGESMEKAFNGGLRNIQDAFRVAETKDVGEMREKTVELWKKTFECLRQANEAQIANFGTAVSKWTELMMKAAPTNFTAN